MMGDDFVTNVHLVYQDNQSTIVLVKLTSNMHKPRSKKFKVRQEYVRECLGTGELEIEYMKTGKMLADILTKPLGDEHFHTIAHAILGNHRFVCFSNRGAKSEKVIEKITRELAGVSCSNHMVAAKRVRL
jgi:tRNA U38,U39,U40 pseudouridine synthase TruA